MGTFSIGLHIPLPTQTVTVDGVRDNDIWCSGINYAAGLGATTANFLLPFALADEIGDRYQYKKVVVRTEGLLFVGYLPGKTEDLSPESDGVSMTALSAGAFLGKIGVGDDRNQWRYQYHLFDDVTGELTGWTPAKVLEDLFDRLPEQWKSEISLGRIDAIADAYDLPVQNYDFSLATYRNAVEMVIGSLGDVAVRERFQGNKCYLDFFRISDVQSPRKSVRVAEFDDGLESNVATYSPSVAGEETLSRVVAFGSDREFMVTSRSVVAGLPDISEPPNEAEQYPTALLKDWDPSLEALVLADPKMAGSDKVSRGCKIVGSADPGTTGVTFSVEVGINLMPGKMVLVHPASGERMLVMGFAPRVPADPLADPPVAGVPASVTVQRLYQAEPSTEPGNLKINESLTIEAPGLNRVFRRYRLPQCLRYLPKKELRSDLPVVDLATRERIDAQLFIYPSALTVNSSNDGKRLGNIMRVPRLISGNKSLDKHLIHLERPAVVPVMVEIKDGKQIVTYQETVVGVTYSYIDSRWPFGWDTGRDSGIINLPWQVHTERLRLSEFAYCQVTNEGWPVETPEGNVVFGALFIHPRTGALMGGEPAVLRNDISYLKMAAERLLQERNRRHVTANITIPWLDSGYQIGDRLEVEGLRNQPQEILTITGVSLKLDANGSASTSLTVDNVKPPSRKRFNTHLGRSV